MALQLACGVRRLSASFTGCGNEVTSAGGATPRFSGEVKIGRRPSQDGRPYKRPPHHTFNRSIGDYGGGDG